MYSLSSKALVRVHSLIIIGTEGHGHASDIRVMLVLVQQVRARDGVVKARS